MKRLFLSREMAYTGRELHSLWAYRCHGLQGDSICAFVGPCEVATEDLVDEADRKEGGFIRSERMLHFIAEHFERDLEKACRACLIDPCTAASATPTGIRNCFNKLLQADRPWLEPYWQI